MKETNGSIVMDKYVITLKENQFDFQQKNYLVYIYPISWIQMIKKALLQCKAFKLWKWLEY